MATPTTLPSTFVAGNVLTAAQMNNLRGAFRILQVVSTTKTDTFTSSSTTYTDITGLSVTITPSSTSSQVLVFFNLSLAGQSGVTRAAGQLVRGSTAIGNAAAAGNRIVGMICGPAITDNTPFSWPGVFLDSPATTSATTYKLQARVNSAGTFYVNRSEGDADATASNRVSSTITAFEVSA